MTDQEFAALKKRYSELSEIYHQASMDRQNLQMAQGMRLILSGGTLDFIQIEVRGIERGPLNVCQRSHMIQCGGTPTATRERLRSLLHEALQKYADELEKEISAQ